MKIISKKTVIPAVIILVIIIIVSALKPPPEQAVIVEAAASRVPVRTQEISLQSVELTTGAAGVIRSRYEIPIMTEIGGTVVRKVRNLGDPVSKGDAVVALDAEPYQLAFDQTQAGFNSAKAAFDQAERDHQRAEDLHATEDISRYELENAGLMMSTAEANLQMAEAGMKLAQRNLRLTKLSSPIDGYVADLDALIGQQVSPGMPLGLIVSLAELEIEIGLSEREVVNITAGDAVRIQSDVLPDRAFEGKVKSVGIAGLDLGRTFPVIISVDNENRKLKPGMIVDLTIIYEQINDAIVIPRNALVSGEASQSVFVLQGESVQQREVMLGPEEGLNVIIQSGLEVGEKLVIEGQNVLSDGAPAKEL